MDNTKQFANPKTVRYSRKNSESLQSASTSRCIVLPANPLPKRKGIPLNSPRFGRMKRYIALPPFNTNDTISKFEYKPQAIDKGNPLLERQIEIQAYINATSMLSKLVYLKTKFDKEGKIDMENIVNLKKPILFNKKVDHSVKQYYSLSDKDDPTIIFESRFESGNLLCAYKVDETPQLTKYNLILQNDTNTTGYIQWFFYRITNTKKNRKVNLSIVNLLRKTSLYSSGMKVWCYSEKKAFKEKIGWHRAGENVTYYVNNMYVLSKEKKRVLYTLSYDYEFEYDNDTVYFANSLPFFYSDLMKELNNYQLEESKYPYFHRKTLCTTLGGNDLDMFTINGEGSNDNGTSNMVNNSEDTRKGIVLIARQHPGETCSSYVMKGAMDFLLGNSDEAIQLRKLYLIKIVPMVNVDGVIIGNSRTSFAGCDLNRRWASTNAIIHPEIFYTKEMIHKMAAQREISFICDFHGHIGAFNSFFYCNSKENNRRACSLFPFICSKTSKIISFLQSSFKMPKYKNGTGRINLFKELELNNIVALETSFFGSNRMGDYNHVYFNSHILKEIGRDVCLGMLAYYYKYENKSIEKNLTLTDIDMKEFDTEMIKEEAKEESDESSESEPSIDNLDKDKIMSLLPTKFKYRKKKKSLKSSLMKSLFQFSSKRLPKENDINADKLLLNSLKGSSSAMNISNKNPLVLKEARSKSIPRSFVNPMSQLSTNTSRFEKKDLLVDDSLLAKTKTEQGTQTEEVFFKMHWTYFAGKYPIKQAKILLATGKRFFDKSNSSLSNRNRPFNGNNFSFSNSGRYPLIANQNNYQVNQFKKQLLHGFQYNHY